LRDAVASKLSTDELVEGQRLALRWTSTAPIGLVDSWHRHE
jgi:hypothetical protein